MILPHRRDVFHNRSWLLAIAKKTTHTRFFITVRKGLWENTSKKSHRWRVKNKNHIPEWTHMCKPSHAQHRQIFTEEGTFSLNMSCDALSYGGGVQTIPLVKQRLRNSQNVWNSTVSHIFHLPKQIKGSLCAHVWKSRVRYLLLCQTTSTKKVYLSFYFLTPQIIYNIHFSRWSPEDW